MLWAAGAVCVVVGAIATAVLRLNGASTAEPAPARIQVVDTSLSLRPGEARRLFVLRGFHYGVLGRFVAKCDMTRPVRTRYVAARTAPDELVAVDGRGTARGAKLGLEARMLAGGSAASGIEHWIVSAGGEPEEVRLDAALVAFPASSGPDACELSLHGRLEIQPR
jgi:hypothetical protein